MYRKILYKKTIVALLSLFVLSTLQAEQRFTRAEVIRYYKRIAFGSSIGGDKDHIKKWPIGKKTLYVWVKPSDFPEHEEMLAVVDQVIDDINKLSSSLKLKRTDSASQAGMHLLFGTAEEYVKNDPDVLSILPGLVENKSSKATTVFYKAGQDFIIYKARSFVDPAAYRDDKERRDYLIRSYLTGGLGFLLSNYDYETSFCYKGYSDTTEFLEMDQRILRLHLNPGIKPGMNSSDLDKVLSAIKDI